MNIEKNIAAVNARMESAAKKSGRRVSEISLMAVTKTLPAEAIHRAYQCGLRLFGENRVQEFAEKAPFVSELPEAEFRLIGHLQSNKAAKAAGLFAGIDSVDSLRLLERIHAAAEKLGKVMPILIEVNVGGEEAKSGVAPVSSEFELILRAAPELKAIEIRGLMTVPPFTEDPEGARPYFRMLRKVRDEIAARKMMGIRMDELSMGMSHDFEVAIEEGSTCVRVGTALFGARSTTPPQRNAVA